MHRLGGRTARLVGLAACALTMAVASSCGGDPANGSPTPLQFERIIKKARTSLDAHDYKGLCAQLSRSAHDQLGTAGHRFPTTCPRDARKFFPPLFKRMQSHSTPQVKSVRVDGRRAWATVMLASNRSAVAPFVIEGGRWKLASVAGVGPLGTPTTIAPASIPAKARSVRVTRERGSRDVPCPELGDADNPEAGLSGGCLLKMKAVDVELTLVTMFGRFLFAHCTSDLKLLVGGDGRLAIASFGFQGEVGCPEVEPCTGDVRGSQGRGMLYPADERNPLEGIIYGDLSVCLDSCVGRFAGDLRLAFVPNPEVGWHVETVTDISQQLGFGIIGAWAPSARTISIRPQA